MERIPARSERAGLAHGLVLALQRDFVAALEALAGETGAPDRFKAVEWFRDQGRHGGGVRYECAGEQLFNRASVNVSQVQYDDEPGRKLASATALSSIVHPAHPLAPSMHLHISWTETKDGHGYWRIMADLNPAIETPGQGAEFAQALRQAAPAQYEVAATQGDRYFWIPALQRHRGISHFYLEAYASGDEAADRALAGKVARAAIELYPRLIRAGLAQSFGPDALRLQQAYHTLYFFQVLTLDRGTTSGLLIHDQNDIGILGSLPARIDRALLASWQPLLEAPQHHLLTALLAALPAENPCPIDDAVKQRLAAALRAHYRAHPEALALQAAGDVIPPTVANHDLIQPSRETRSL